MVHFGILPVDPELLAFPEPIGQVELLGNDDQLLLNNDDGLLTE